MANSPAALGLRVHSGWAALVALAGPQAEPVLLERTRLALADEKARGPLQPYHAAAEIDLTEAEVFLERLAVETAGFARAGLEKIAARLRAHGFELRCCAILFASGRQAATLAQTLASHALIHAAEGDFFRNAIARAAEELGWRVVRIKEREIWEHAQGSVERSRTVLQEHLTAMGKTAGPPWQQDQKLAALAAWTAL